MPAIRYPALYQINTRVLLTALSRVLERPATLDDMPDADLDRLAAQGFDWVWFLSVWQIGLAGQRVSRTNPEWRQEFQATLPDLCEEDIAGSGFAITSYTVPAALGGDAALGRLRERMRQRGLNLMLDFVPNHMGLDHPWLESHPAHFIQGTESDLASAPQNWIRLNTQRGTQILAHGRDPYFPGWPDTLQLNYGNPATQNAMAAELVRIAERCDGVRCDMAMLVLPDIFRRTWGVQAESFWPMAIGRVRERSRHFCFMAEVYWDMEWPLQQLGFDYAYDKRLYDRLHAGHARPVREHFLAGLDYQDKLARFLENHDEPRAATTFPPGKNEAAAVITFLSPGLRFFHQGQLEGRTKRISPHLVRGPAEPVNPALAQFYDKLLRVARSAVVREGDWRLLECVAAWEGNWTWDCFVAFAWQCGEERLLVATNFAANQSQCVVRLPFGKMAGTWRLTDLLGESVYERAGDELSRRGLFLDMPAWGTAVYDMRRMGV